MVEVVLHLLPEVGHSGEGIVAQHGPHGVGIGTGEEYPHPVPPREGSACGQQFYLLFGQREDAVVFEEDNRLGGDVVSGPALLGGVELDIFGAIEIGIAVEEACTELYT